MASKSPKNNHRCVAVVDKNVTDGLNSWICDLVNTSEVIKELLGEIVERNFGGRRLRLGLIDLWIEDFIEI